MLLRGIGSIYCDEDLPGTCGAGKLSGKKQILMLFNGILADY